MGLSIYIGDDDRSAVGWSYGGFGQLRRALARHEGIDLDRMEGFGDGNRSWDTVTTDLKPLLNHPDDHGDLTPEQCARVVPRLREVLSDLQGGEDWRFLSGLKLAEAMDQAVARNIPLNFH